MQDLILTKPKTVYDYTEEKIAILFRGLSNERLKKYAALAPYSKINQLELYSWNTALSESLYTPIQALEIITRNYFNNKLAENFGTEWYDNFIFSPIHFRCIQEAKSILKIKNKIINSDNITSLLSFGFWTGLLGSKYETILWRPCLYRAFQNKPKPFLRKYAHNEFDLIRLLRNRIAHHEPILRKDLPNQIHRIYKMIKWFCDETFYWINLQCNFSKVWNSPVNPFI